VLDIDSLSEPVVAEALAEHGASARRHGCLAAYVYVHENPHRVGGGLLWDKARLTVTGVPVERPQFHVGGRQAGVSCQG
jgi:hypothetical protein